MAAIAAVAMTLFGFSLGAPLETRADDARLALRRDRGWPKDLVLVAIDDVATAREGRWPWPRPKIKDLVDRLTQLGAKTIAMDIIYQAPTNATDDRALASALSHTFIAVGFAPEGGAEIRPEVLDAALLHGTIALPPQNVIEPDRLALPTRTIAGGAAGIGHVALFTQPDGRVRTIRPFLEVRGGSRGFLPTLPLRAYLAQRGLPESGLAATPSALTLPDGRTLPLTNGELRLDFVPHGAKAPRISAEQVMTLDPKARDAVAGKLALVFTDSSYALDRIPNPLAPEMPGGMDFAYFIRTIDFGSSPRVVSSVLGNLLILLVLLGAGIAAAPFAERLAPQRIVGLYAAAAGLIGVATIAFVPLFDLFLPVVVPIFGVLGIGIAIAVARGRAVENERQRLRALLRTVPAFSEASELSMLPLPERATVLPADGARPGTPAAAGAGGRGGDRPTNVTSPTATQGVTELLGGRALEQPVKLGKYLVTRRLGRGGMGAIFYAVDQDLERAVAIKVLEAAADPGSYARFRREALAVARVSDPHVVQIHEIGFDAEVPFIVMEYVGGGTLTDLIREGGLEGDWKRASRIVAGTARGLGAAHVRGIVHRDVKPANILLRDARGDFAKIADFGIAKLSSAERLTREGSFVGTIGYLSPEQAQGKEVDARSDVFSLGITWYRALTGRSAFEGSTAEVLRATTTRAIPDPRILAPHVPAEIAKILEAMTSLDPAERPRDGNAAAQWIESVLGDPATRSFSTRAS